MTTKTKYAITVEQGEELLFAATGFGLPAKLAKEPYSYRDQSLAAEDVLKFRAVLMDASPLMHETDNPRKRILFGPKEAWNKTATEERESWKMAEPHREVEIELDEDAHMGAKWTLVLMLHPLSSTVKTVGLQADVLWPAASRLRLRTMLRKEIGLADAEHKRLILDDKKET